MNATDDSRASLDAPASREPPQAGAAQAPLRVLLVEDNAASQKLVQLQLRRFGYELDVASDGEEAVEAARRNEYDVILMDVQMPGMSGIEATQRIRQESPAGRRPRIIAMTAYAMQGDRGRCLEAGMDDYVSKPVRAEELARLLARSRPVRA